jgi:phosphatidylinositol alpha 1,6-mannosyltransferase
MSNGFHERLRIWPRGVDAQHFHPQGRSDEMRARLAPGAKTILLYVGRLAPEKRLPVLLDAFDMVNARCAGTALVIVGDRPAAASCTSATHPMCS